MGFQDSKSNIYGDDGSTSTEAFLVGTDLYVASPGRPQGVISKAGKDDDSTASATGTHLFATVVSEAILLDTGKGEPYQRTDMDSESHTSCYDGLATEKAISLCTDIFSQAVKPMSGEDGHLVGGNVVVEAVISKAGEGEPDSHGSQAVILKELISKDCKGGPYLHYERDTYRDDGSTTKEAISLCNDPIVTPTVIPMSGKGETCQRTICVGSLDSESNTCHDDGSILGCDRTDRSTTTMGLTCENSGGSRGSPAVKPNSDKGEPDSHGSQAGELISKDFKGGPYMDFLHFGRNAYLHFDDSTTKEAISLCNDLGVSAMSGKGETCQSTEMGILESESNTCHDDGSTASDRVLGGTCLVAKFIGSEPGLYLESGEGETCQSTEMGILESESNTYHDDGSTASDRVLGGTRLVAKFIGSEPGLYLESGEGETFQSTELGVLESESNDSTARGLGSTRLGAKFIDSQPGRIHLAADEGEPYPRTDVGSPDSESNTSRYDGLATEEEAISLCHDIVSQAAIPMSGKGETCQTTDVDSESSTCHDDGSTASGGSQKGKGLSMESLPSDIVQDILSRVPTELVLECKLVCKKWVTLIRGSNFANMHLGHQLNNLHSEDDSNDNLAAAKVEPCLFFACRIDDPDNFITLLFHGGRPSDRISVDEKYIYNQNLKRIYHPRMHDEPIWTHLVGSCNGLVCTFQVHHLVRDPIYICNPLTREYVYLPKLVVKEEDVDPDGVEEEDDIDKHTACGFGYVRSTNEYKVVRIHYLDGKEGNVEVYTLGSGRGWRAIGRVSYGGLESTGTYANDAIYWCSSNNIVVFELADEGFQLLSVPPGMQYHPSGDRFRLVALGRHLCLYMNNRLGFEIWSLMKSSDSKETWRKEFDMDYGAVANSTERKFKLQPILVTKSGEIIFLYARSVLYSYDTKTSLLKMISNEASSDHFDAVEAIAHVNTLASLRSMGENSKTYTVRPCCDGTQLDDVMDELDRGEEIDRTRFSFR